MCTQEVLKWNWCTNFPFLEGVILTYFPLFLHIIASSFGISFYFNWITSLWKLRDIIIVQWFYFIFKHMHLYYLMLLNFLHYVKSLSHHEDYRSLLIMILRSQFYFEMASLPLHSWLLCSQFYMFLILYIFLLYHTLVWP